MRARLAGGEAAGLGQLLSVGTALGLVCVPEACDAATLRAALAAGAQVHVLRRARTPELARPRPCVLRLPLVTQEVGGRSWVGLRSSKIAGGSRRCASAASRTLPTPSTSSAPFLPRSASARAAAQHASRVLKSLASAACAR